MKKIAVLAIVLAMMGFFSSGQAVAGDPTACAFRQVGCDGDSGFVIYNGGHDYWRGQDVGLKELITLPARIDVELARLKAETEYWKALKRAYKNQR